MIDEPNFWEYFIDTLITKLDFQIKLKQLFSQLLYNIDSFDFTYNNVSNNSRIIESLKEIDNWFEKVKQFHPCFKCPYFDLSDLWCNQHKIMPIKKCENNETKTQNIFSYL